MGNGALTAAGIALFESALEGINRGLGELQYEVAKTNSDVQRVDQNVADIAERLDDLAREFDAYVSVQTLANAKSYAQQNLIHIRQNLEKNFGQYGVVRRTVTGILQVNDLALVKKATVEGITEELMLTTPRYWLTPNLIALNAWISDNKELADRALAEGIRRDNEKTSLFWTLVCRRAGRQDAAIRWLKRYLESQDEENISAETLTVIDAYTNGLLGFDSESIVSTQIDRWLERLKEKPGFVEKQITQWTEGILLKKKAYNNVSYGNLPAYSTTWPKLVAVMEKAELHESCLAYFKGIMEAPCATETLTEQLDDILDRLVTDFDDEERPLKEEEKYNQFVIDFGGDEKRAQQQLQLYRTQLEDKKDFTQILTDIAMKTEGSRASASARKFALALSKDWIIEAYNDLTASYRSQVPQQIEIHVDTFHDQTVDGSDEEEILKRFEGLVEQERADAMKDLHLTQMDNSKKILGILLVVAGVVLFATGQIFVGVVALGIGAMLFFKVRAKKKQIEEARAKLEALFDKRLKVGQEALRALLAEVVDFRAEFAEKDAKSELVTDYLSNISKEQYLGRLDGTPRRVLGLG